MNGPAESLARGAKVVFVPPPLYYVTALVGGLQLHRVAPFPVGARPATAIAGAILVALGLAFTLLGAAWVVRHRTTIVPHRPVATLLTGGPYRLSRNPMYTGLAAALIGGALLADSWWPIVLTPVVLIVVTTLVIKPEETYLAQRFGRTYAQYRGSVRRWL